MSFALKFTAAAVLVLAAGGAFAQKGETVKMVRIDPLTGLLGPVGVSQLKGYQFFAEKFSGAGNPAGVKFEVTGIDISAYAIANAKEEVRDRLQVGSASALPFADKAGVDQDFVAVIFPDCKRITIGRRRYAEQQGANQPRNKSGTHNRTLRDEGFPPAR